MKDIFNIYMAGVGGQGIGLLSQALLTATDHAGIKAIAVDTHGLAQRGGVVVSRIRCGEDVYSPLTLKGKSHLILALEVHEAMRALSSASHVANPPSPTPVSEGKATLCFLDVTWQPLSVRTGEAKAITPEEVETLCRGTGIIYHRVESKKIKDSRMQNMALLGTLAGNRLIPGVEISHYQRAIEDLLQGDALKQNMALFQKYASPSVS